MQNRLTDIQIAARIAPTMLRWPTGTVACDHLRDCVTALRDLVRSVDDGCLEAEQDRKMSSDGIRRQRAVLGSQALAKLANFKPLQLAEKAVAENIDSLDRDRPEQTQMQERLTKALKELREGVAATRRMVLERCKMREDQDGPFRDPRIVAARY